MTSKSDGTSALDSLSLVLLWRIRLPDSCALQSLIFGNELGCNENRFGSLRGLILRNAVVGSWLPAASAG